MPREKVPAAAQRMRLDLQRTIDRVVGVPLCAFLSLVESLWPRPEPSAPPRRILVILLSEMGSLVLARPMFARLKERYPEAHLHALLLERNREVLDLLEVVPETNVLTLDDRSLFGLVASASRAISTLRRLGIDAVVDCELFARVSSILAYLSGARIRAGFHPFTQRGLYRGSLINRGVLYNPYRHLSRQLLSLSAALESHTLPGAKEDSDLQEVQVPMLAIGAAELEAAAQRLEGDFPQIRGRPLILLYPSGGILPIRAWPLSHYCAVAQGLVEDGHAVGVIGLEQDRPLASEIVGRSQSSRCIDLTGYTSSVRQLLQLFHRASLLVLNDSGPGQFAALTPVPSIVLFGPETPVLYAPLSKNVHCFHQSLPCSPCLTAFNHRVSPCDGDNQCLKRIAPEEVLLKAREILARSRAQKGGGGGASRAEEPPS